MPFASQWFRKPRLKKKKKRKREFLWRQDWRASLRLMLWGTQHYSWEVLLPWGQGSPEPGGARGSSRQSDRYRGLGTCTHVRTHTHRSHLWACTFKSQHVLGVRRVCSSHTPLPAMERGCRHQRNQQLNGPCPLVGGKVRVLREPGELEVTVGPHVVVAAWWWVGRTGKLNTWNRRPPGKI